jgi:hypothetical protein
MNSSGSTPSTPFTHEGVWCCSRQCKCRWQGYVLTHGLGWGTVPTILTRPLWYSAHYNNCDGKLIQLVEPGTFVKSEPVSSLLDLLVRPDVVWFVRDRRSNGTRWESDQRHQTKRQAEDEMKWWEQNATDTGEMNVWREIYPNSPGRLLVD